MFSNPGIPFEPQYGFHPYAACLHHAADITAFRISPQSRAKAVRNGHPGFTGKLGGNDYYFLSNSTSRIFAIQYARVHSADGTRLKTDQLIMPQWHATLVQNPAGDGDYCMILWTC